MEMPSVTLAPADPMDSTKLSRKQLPSLGCRRRSVQGRDGFQVLLLQHLYFCKLYLGTRCPQGPGLSSLCFGVRADSQFP